jgi:dephospho-CoA kinase
MAFVVGLTGGIGSGKSVVADLFAGLGITVVDADLVAREVVQPGSTALKAIAEHFGDVVIKADGTLDRPVLRQLVFRDEENRRWLEELLHPLIRTEIETRLAQSRSPYSLLVSPLLFETGQNRLTNRVVVVDVPEEIQLERAMRRDNNDEEQIRAIMKSQASRDNRLKRADDVIDNSGTLAELEPVIASLHQTWLELATGKEI